jgi:hypothetical protein
VPRKITGTLTLSNLGSVHTLVFTIILYKSCAIATPKHRDPSHLENYVRIIVFALVLQRASFSWVIKFL